VSLDAALLLSALTSSGHDTPTIAYGSDDLSPLLILAPGFRGLVMPCRR
jgi:hypothetical protein